MKKFSPGEFVRFTYNHQAVDDQTGSKFKEVLILNPSWQNKVHGVDLKRLNPLQREIIEFLLDPKNDNVQSRIAKVNEVRKNIDPIEEIGNPMIFYTRFLKPFLGKTDAYRQYIEKLITNRVTIKEAPSRPNRPHREPLFGEKPNAIAKQGSEAQPKALTPIDIMAQNAKNKGLK
jgi:hypothetical protein